MKKFIFLFLMFIGLCCCITLALRAVWVRTAPLTLKRNFIGNDIHYLVLGPSNGESAWNDKVIKHSYNLCASGTSFGSCYNKLKWVSEYNDNQVDTVVLCASMMSFLYERDSWLLPYVEEADSKLDYWSFYDFFKNRLDYWKCALTSFPILNLDLRQFKGGFVNLKRDKINHPKRFDGINNILNMVGGKDGVTEQFLKDKCKYQLIFLRKIKEYCDKHDKTLVILSTPLYKISDMVSDSGYRRLLLSELGDSTLIADYSRFQLPDSTCFGDLEHLNYRGAEYFSKHIAENGLDLQYAIDYSKQ